MTELPKLNAPLLRKVLQMIEEEPRRYNQWRWVSTVPTDVAPCGTQACIAGWAVLADKPKEEWPAVQANMIRNYIGVEHYIRKTAMHLLGLTLAEAGALFSSTNQADVVGPKGVACAREKINALIEDREHFVDLWSKPNKANYDKITNPAAS